MEFGLKMVFCGNKFVIGMYGIFDFLGYFIIVDGFVWCVVWVKFYKFIMNIVVNYIVYFGCYGNGFCYFYIFF